MPRSVINREMSDFARHVTSVSENLGRDVDRAKIAADLLYELESWYRVMDSRGREVYFRGMDE